MTKGVDPLLRPERRGLFEARQRRHLHNSFSGHLRMAHCNMESIARASTTTPEAKEQARRVQAELTVLGQLLQTRVDR